MKERLVELIRKAERNFLTNGTNIPQMAEVIADYLLENGVVVPSYNVGDTLYVADKETSNEVEEIHIEGIETFKYEGLGDFVLLVYRAFITSGKQKGEGIKFTDSNKNRIVFPTREEAQAKLKEGGKE